MRRALLSVSLAAGAFKAACGCSPSSEGGPTDASTSDRPIVHLEASLTTGARVVRLSDGGSWPIMTPTPKTWGYWQGPIALTCTEFFASVWSNGQNNVFRVRLDSLGAGEPPD